MASKVLSVVAIVLLGCDPALAEDIACVQRELARLGLDPGPVDGVLGKKTLDAAAIYHVGAAYLQDLEPITAPEWCETLLKQADLSFDAAQLPVEEPAASAGATVFHAIEATPILGVTPEYEVPKWVYRPH